MFWPLHFQIKVGKRYTSETRIKFVLLLTAVYSLTALKLYYYTDLLSIITHACRKIVNNFILFN